MCIHLVGGLIRYNFHGRVRRIFHPPTHTPVSLHSEGSARIAVVTLQQKFTEMLAEVSVSEFVVMAHCAFVGLGTQ